jgi:hypothetical protein
VSFCGGPGRADQRNSGRQDRAQIEDSRRGQVEFRSGRILIYVCHLHRWVNDFLFNTLDIDSLRCEGVATVVARGDIGGYLVDAGRRRAPCPRNA